MWVQSIFYLQSSYQLCKLSILSLSEQNEQTEAQGDDVATSPESYSYETEIHSQACLIGKLVFFFVPYVS